MTQSILKNPLMDQVGLPKFAQIDSTHIEPAIGFLLDEMILKLESLEESLTSESSYEDTVEELEKVTSRVDYAWGVINHLISVNNSEYLRAAHTRMQPKVVEATQKIGQSRKIYKALEGLSKRKNALDTHIKRRIVDGLLLSMKLGGVGLEGDSKNTYNSNSQKLSKLGTSFSNNVLDATKSFQLLIKVKKDIDGLPESARNSAAQKAFVSGMCECANPNEGPWLLGLDIPSYLPAIKHIKSEKIRETLYKAFVNRAGDTNTPLIYEILALKQEQARLLGFNTYAEVSISSKMADSITEIEDLHNMLATKAVSIAKTELTELQEYSNENGHKGSLKHWDVPMWSEKLKAERYNFKEEELRPYFAFPIVIEGLFRLITRLFDVTIHIADGKTEVWNDDVQYFEIKEDDEVIASFYLDPYSRPENKRGGAWMNTCIDISKALGRKIPTAYITCNGTPPVDDKPSLMTFNEVRTLYHEMGHGLQHMLTKIDDGGASGINGIEWDAVELPSQFMENWLLDKKTLYGFAKHYITGEPLPEEYYIKIKGASRFHSGLIMSRQIAFGQLDIELHSGKYDPMSSNTIFDIQRDIFAKFTAMPPLESDRFLCAFGHIFAGGYACGYYSYKWAEVLSADAFAAFEEVGLDNEVAIRSLGKKFRNTIFACGGGTHPSDVFKSFRGRPPSTDALIRHNFSS